MGEPLVWCDCEMSGLNPDRDVILEIALRVTGSDLLAVDEGLDLAVHQPESVLEGMDEWNRTHHGASGLVARVRASTIDTGRAEELCLEYLRRHCRERTAPLCGNTIWQDRRFLCRHMPRLDAFLHYRLVDVSTIKELCARWYPGLTPFEKKKDHRALADIGESIAELAHYRRVVFRAVPDTAPAQEGKPS